MLSAALDKAFAEVVHNSVFSDLISDRRTAVIIGGAGVIHIGLSLAGVSLWTCPFRAATGVPCPGCGFTRATLEFLRGDLTGSLKTHAFAPIFLCALAIILVTWFLPERQRQGLLSALRNCEERTGLTAWVLLGLMLYWVLRIMGMIPFPKIF